MPVVNLARLSPVRGSRRNARMTRTPNAEETQRVPLTRERLFAAAIAVADHGGLGALTIRSLADALGVKPMAIYHHVANKDEILGGMIDAVFAEIALPPRDADWRSAIRERAVSAREVLRRHPWGVGLMDSRRRPGPATLRHHDAVIGTLRRGGFPVDMVAHAYSLLDSYTYGFTVQEAALPVDDGDAPTAAAEFQAHLDPATYPHLAELTASFASGAGEAGDEFEYGLELVLDSLEGMLRPRGKGAKRARR
jgi:AcrR family transcriptional regulator